MKKILILLTCLISLFSTPAKSEENRDLIGYKEYGIAIILPNENYIQAHKLRHQIANQLSLKQNHSNIFHVTLFQGRFSKANIDELYQDLKAHNLPKIKLQFEPEIKAAEDRYINWQVKKTPQLVDLHNSIVQIATPYHQGVLARYIAAYNQLTKEQRLQAVCYGMAGVLDQYNPHTSLFYLQQKNPDLKTIIPKISVPDLKKLPATKISQIVIAELGYNGNLEKILYTIDLN